MDDWYAIYEEATGRLVSSGTVIATDDELKANGLVAMPIKAAPGRCEWDEKTCAFLPEVLKTNMPNKQEVIACMENAVEQLKKAKLAGSV